MSQELPLNNNKQVMELLPPDENSLKPLPLDEKSQELPLNNNKQVMELLPPDENSLKSLPLDD